MSDFPTSEANECTHWSVWRGDKWLGEWLRGEPMVGEKIKPKECLTAKQVVRIDKNVSRIYVK